MKKIGGQFSVIEKIITSKRLAIKKQNDWKDPLVVVWIHLFKQPNMWILDWNLIQWWFKKKKQLLLNRNLHTYKIQTDLNQPTRTTNCLGQISFWSSPEKEKMGAKKHEPDNHLWMIMKQFELQLWLKSKLFYQKIQIFYIIYKRKIFTV